MRSMNNGNGLGESGASSKLGRFSWETALAKAGEWTFWRMIENQSPLTI